MDLVMPSPTLDSASLAPTDQCLHISQSISPKYPLLGIGGHPLLDPLSCFSCGLLELLGGHVFGALP